MIKIRHITSFTKIIIGSVNDNDVIAISDQGKIVMSSCLPTKLKLAEEYVRCMMDTIKQYKEIKK